MGIRPGTGAAADRAGGTRAVVGPSGPPPAAVTCFDGVFFFFTHRPAARAPLAAVGKTSHITRFMYDSFDNSYQVRRPLGLPPFSLFVFS